MSEEDLLEQSIRVDLVLADYAHVDTALGKVSLIGGGWSTLVNNGQFVGPIAVVIFLEVPWDQTNIAHEWALRLLGADGQPVVVQSPAGPQEVHVAGQFEAGRPTGTPRGTPIGLQPMAANFQGLPLEPGRYEFRFFIDGETHEGWYRAFSVVASAPQQSGPGRSA